MLKKEIAYGRMEGMINHSIAVKKLINNVEYFNAIFEIALKISLHIEKGGKLMLCGNGGSAADAQHLAAELLIRLRSSFDRDALPAISLAMDASTITACGNDYSFDDIYSRIIQALANKNDVLMVITTSGNSKNITNALKMAKKKKIITIGLLGGGGGEAVKYCDYSLVVPDDNTARIQESHIMLGHIIMELIEDNLQDIKYI